MNSLSVVFEPIIFLLAVFSLFYLPGKFLIVRLNLKPAFLEDIFLALTTGMLLFTLLVYALSWLKIWGLTVPVLLLVDILVLKSGDWRPAPFKKVNPVSLFLVIILSLIFSLTITPFGLYGDSIVYRGDDLWHLGLINELKAHFPPDHPGFAGFPLKGYHYFYDLLLAKVSQISGLSSLSLYYHFFPLLLSLLWGTGVYVLMKKWSRSDGVSLWAVFLTFFGGSFSFLLHLYGYPGYSLDDAFGITQPTGSLTNPPFTVSIVFLVMILFSLYHFLKERERKWLGPIILGAGLVSMFKVYAGMIVFGGLAVLAALELIKKRHDLLVALGLSGLVFLGTYWLLADRSAVLLLQPLWAPRKVLTDHFPWYNYWEKRNAFLRSSATWSLFKIELFGLTVFILGSLGTRLFGFSGLIIEFLKRRQRPSVFVLAVFSMSCFSILIPLFFIQSGKVFEIIQMAWYFLFLASLVAAFGFVFWLDLIRRAWLKGLIVFVVLSLTLPSAFEKFTDYVELSRKRESFSSPYFQAMAFLETQGNYDDTVLQIPPVEVGVEKEPILAWYGKTNPAIAALADKRLYLANEYIVFSELDVEGRAALIQKIAYFNIKTSPLSPGREGLRNEIVKGLREGGVVYIYSPYGLSSFDTIEAVEKIYANGEETIYRVKRE